MAGAGRFDFFFLMRLVGAVPASSALAMMSAWRRSHTRQKTHFQGQQKSLLYLFFQRGHSYTRFLCHIVTLKHASSHCDRTQACGRLEPLHEGPIPWPVSTRSENVQTASPIRHTTVSLSSCPRTRCWTADGCTISDNLTVFRPVWVVEVKVRSSSPFAPLFQAEAESL
jgi:hypothetical protein